MDTFKGKWYIETEQISKQFGEHIVLKDISIKVGAGEIFGLLGPSGAGKTTLIQIVTGQLNQTKGTARLFGIDNSKLPREIYTKLGMVLDNVGLYERLSCYDNLVFFAQLYGLRKSSIPEILARVGLKEAEKKPVERLSKGMKQRLVLARALMHQPDILFLDEPTSGLDPATASYIHELLMEEKQKGTAIFLTTHNMEEATKLCDSVALLNQGNIVEWGAPKEICRKYNFQNEISVLLKTGESIIMKNSSACAQSIAQFFSQEQVESIHSTEPNLETVFMELTGRGLAQ